MKFDIYKEKINDAERDEIVFKIRKQFLGKNKETKLMWNSFNEKPKCLSFEEILNIGIPNHNVYFFLERQNELYITTLKDIVNFVNGFEPWEEIDAYVFDESMLWILAITHEDNKILCIGI